MSIYKRIHKKTKKTQYRFITAYYGADGKRHQKGSAWFDAKSDAEHEERKFLVSCDQHSPAINITFEKLVYEYFREKELNNECSTVVVDRNKVELHILPYFESKKINSITPLDVREWKIGMQEKEYTYNKKEFLTKNYTIRFLKDLYTLFAAIMEYGLKYYGLNVNVVKRVGNFKKKKGERTQITPEQFYTYDEFQLFLSAINDPFYFTVFNVLYFSGCRSGEFRALKVRDFDGKGIAIDKSLTTRTNGNEKYILKNPKNESSYRYISLPIYVCGLINDLILKYKNMAGFSSKWFLFGGTAPLANTTFTRNKNKYCKMAGLKQITLHGFRHSHASLLINSDRNINILSISARLGHNDATETLNTYGHMFPSQNALIHDFLNDLSKNVT